MARKSRLTLWQEELAQISECPVAIFDKIEPDEKTFDTVKLAEIGNAQAIRQTVCKLYEVYKDEAELNPALPYFIRLGLDAGDSECAKAALGCFAIFDEPKDLVGRAIEILSEQSDKPTRDSAQIKLAVIEAIRNGDEAKATEILSLVDGRAQSYARIFLAAGCGADVNADAEAIGIPNLVYLPVFTGADSQAQSRNGSVDELHSLADALGMIRMDEWRDFWLKAIYEYSTLFAECRMASVIDKIITAINERCEYPSKKLHLLALTKYAKDTTDTVSTDEYEMLEDECRFAGLSTDLSTDEARDELIKEAIYTSGAHERAKAKNAARLGTVIRHTKNRYALNIQVSNHLKRGFKHIWKTTLSLEGEQKSTPAFSILHIDQRRYAPMRCGTELEAKKKLAQIICSGQISVNDKVYPIEADVIVDISYVSTTKCGNCEIVIKDTKTVDGYLVMECLLTVY